MNPRQRMVARSGISRLRVAILGILITIAAVPSAEAQEDRACEREFIAVRQIGADTARVPASVKVTYDSIRSRLRRCVDSVDVGRKDTSLLRVQTTADSLAMAFFNIPEYHDEGRLPIGGNLLGPMAYIYASPFLGTFSRKAQIFEHGTPGALAVMVVVEDSVPIPTSYAELGLGNGINCIWLQVSGPRPNDTFSAWVSTTASGTACDAKTAGTLRGPLAVVETIDTMFTHPSDYPPVARFEEDVAGRPILAFKCLAAFCEVGRTHSALRVRAPRSRPPIVNPGAHHRLRAIKGWHDEQQLAVRRADGTWMASVHASIVPDTGILNYDSTGFHDVWVPAATLTIHGPLFPGSKYYAWGLRRGDNHIAVQFNMTTRLWVVGIFANRFDAPIPGTRRPRATWKMRERMLHHDAAVPLSARFRWTIADDGIWFPCGNSCCRSDGEIY